VPIIRFIKELLDTRLQCERIGCGHTFREYQGYEKPSQNIFRAVADSVRGRIYFCPRCKKQYNRTVTDRTGLNSLEMDSDRMNVLKDKGFVE